MNDMTARFVETIPAHPVRFGSLRRLLRDDSGSEVLEFALALTFFAVVAIVGFHFIPQAANAQATTDQTNFSQSLANGY
jgi:Flp pilus assembly pilin Flp